MNIGLILSGGMAKGAYQIGALKALNNFIPLQEIKYISCASIGVLNGYAYVTENLQRAEYMWKNICSNDTRYVISQILRSSMLQHNISNLYDENKVITKKFYCSLFDFCNRNVVYKDLSTVNNDQVPLYLKASVAMPMYNRSVQLGNTSYFDGAMIDNIPVYPLLKHNLDYIICVYFDDICYKFENTYFDNKVIKITFPCESKLKKSVVLNKQSIEDMIKNGYSRTTYILKNILSKGYEDLDSVYRNIELMNRNSRNNRLRITGDVLVTNLNKITQRLTKRKIL